MMPGGVLSTTPVISGFLPPDNLPSSNTADYEMGGVGLSNATQGLLVQVWTAWLDGNPGEVGTSVWISSPNTADTQLFAMDGITEISLTFDQNMHPVIAFVAAGVAQLWWYDATIPGYSFLPLEAGAKSPKCSLDDKRPLATLTATSDIILAYVLDDNLYSRIQRERYVTRHLLYLGLSAIIANPSVVKDAMSDVTRLQFMLSGTLYG